MFSIPSAIIETQSRIASIIFDQSWLIISMLFILEVACIPGSARINTMLKMAEFVGTDTKIMKLDSYDGTWYTEHNGTTFMTISHILME